MKKITRNTIKSFIKNNEVYFRKAYEFDGMTDGIEYCHDQSISKAESPEEITKYNLGIKGAYFVGSSRDYFNYYEDDNYWGYEVYNCCSTFYLLTPKEVA